MIRLLALIFCLLLSVNPLFAQTAGRFPGVVTSVTAAEPSTSTVVNLSAPARTLIIKTSATSGKLYIHFGDGAATTADFCLNGNGDGFTWTARQGDPPLSAITLYSDAASGNYSLLGW